jgi:DNA-binding NtrC family response regulator
MGAVTGRCCRQDDAMLPRKVLLLPTDRTKRPILIVVTDPQLRKAIQCATTNHDYQSRLASDAAEAVSLTADYQPQISVIGLDAGLGAATKLADRLRAQSPTLKFIIITTAGDAMPESAQADSLHVLRRPFSMLQFIAAVDEFSI